MFKAVKNVWKTVVDSFRWIVMNDNAAYERLVMSSVQPAGWDEQPNTVTITPVISGRETYYRIVDSAGNPMVDKEYKYPKSARRRAEREGFMVA